MKISEINGWMEELDCHLCFPHVYSEELQANVAKFTYYMYEHPLVDVTGVTILVDCEATKKLKFLALLHDLPCKEDERIWR